MDEFLARIFAPTGHMKFVKMACLAIVLGDLSLAAKASDHALTLRVAVGETKPPYIYSQEQAGVEVELIVSLLKEAGYQPQMLYLPNKRAQLMLEVGAVDAAISPRGEFLSEPYIVYQNVAVTLCSTHIAPKSVAALAGRRVAAFQNAHLFLGNDFAAMAAGNQDYREPPQTSINRMLYARHTDVGISDINVFKRINDELERRSTPLEPWCPYSLFPPTQYRLAFRDRNARDLFNKALKRALKGKLYESLAKRYDLPAINGHPYFKPKPPARGQG